MIELHSDLTVRSSPARLTETGESLPDTVQTLSTILTSHSTGLLAYSHVAHLGVSDIIIYQKDADGVKKRYKRSKETDFEVKWESFH